MVPLGGLATWPSVISQALIGGRLGGRIALSEKAARYQHHYRDKNGRDGALRRPPRPEEITLK